MKIALGMIDSGFLTSSPNVASREYPVNAKNQIEADNKIFKILASSNNGRL